MANPQYTNTDIETRYESAIRQVIPETLRKKEDKNSTEKIADWSPNNIKTLIITGNTLVIEYHVMNKVTQKYGIKSKVMYYQLGNTEESTDSVLNILTRVRLLSAVEEILLVEDASYRNRKADFEADMLYLRQTFTQRGKSEVCKKFPRLRYVGYTNVDTKVIREIMNSANVDKKHISVVEQLRTKYNANVKIGYENSDWWQFGDKYGFAPLRPNFYLIDARPQTGEAVNDNMLLYRCFNGIANSIIAKSKKADTEKLTDKKEQPLIAKSVADSSKEVQEDNSKKLVANINNVFANSKELPNWLSFFVRRFGNTVLVARAGYPKWQRSSLYKTKILNIAYMWNLGIFRSRFYSIYDCLFESKDNRETRDIDSFKSKELTDKLGKATRKVMRVEVPQAQLQGKDAGALQAFISTQNCFYSNKNALYNLLFGNNVNCDVSSESIKQNSKAYSALYAQLAAVSTVTDTKGAYIGGVEGLSLEAEDVEVFRNICTALIYTIMYYYFDLMLEIHTIVNEGYMYKMVESMRRYQKWDIFNDKVITDGSFDKIVTYLIPLKKYRTWVSDEERLNQMLRQTHELDKYNDGKTEDAVFAFRHLVKDFGDTIKGDSPSGWVLLSFINKLEDKKLYEVDYTEASTRGHDLFIQSIDRVLNLCLCTDLKDIRLLNGDKKLDALFGVNADESYV